MTTDSPIIKDAIVKEAALHLVSLSEGWWRSKILGLRRAPRISNPKRNIVQIEIRTESGLRFFEILVREKYT